VVVMDKMAPVVPIAPPACLRGKRAVGESTLDVTVINTQTMSSGITSGMTPGLCYTGGNGGDRSAEEMLLLSGTVSKQKRRLPHIV
jgi:hypothetical protein